MTNANIESLVVAYKKEVAKMREPQATDLEIQSMLEFVEQLTQVTDKCPAGSGH